MAPRASLAAGAVAAAIALWPLSAAQLPAESGADRSARPVGRLPGPSLSPAQKIERTGNRWAQLFAASYPTMCGYMTELACERESSSALRRSFRGATVEDIAIRGERAAASFSNGRTVGLVHVDGFRMGGVWWIKTVTPGQGSARYRHVTGVGRHAGRAAPGKHATRARRLRGLLSTP